MLDLTDPLALFAEEVLVPTRFTYGATGLGKSIDPGGNENDVAKDTDVELPLWLVRPLKRREMVSLKLPALYRDRYRRKFNAGAECVSLKNTAPYFYEAGNKLNELLRDEDLSVFLTRTFKTRYFELISKGLNTMTGEDVLQLSSKLSVEEQQLFEAGRISIAHMDSWLRGEVLGQARSVHLQRHRKRTADQAAVAAAVAPDANKQQKAR
ncbi:hypothetical protein V8C86DRAFT_1814467 [Haematococcus lacustris]